MVIRCTCGQFLKTVGPTVKRCSRCNVDYDNVGYYVYQGSNGEKFAVSNDRLKPIPKEEKKMSFFTFDPKEAGGFEALKPGKYEAVITETKVDESSKGNQMLKVTLTVRDDVKQEYGKRKVFDNWVATPAAMFKFHQVAKALGFAEGQAIDTLEAFAKEVLFKPVKIVTKIEAYNGNDQTRIVAYEPAEQAYGGGALASSSKDPFAGNDVPIEIDDSDLPF